MEEALKKLAHKPNLKGLNEQSTASKRLSARLRINWFTKAIYKHTTPVTGPTSIEIGKHLTKAHNWSMLFTAITLGLGFYSGVLVTLTRKETFKRNFAQIEAKYGDQHREAFGPDTKINRFGYPDMGNNLYSDLLPYKDWIKINNA